MDFNEYIRYFGINLTSNQKRFLESMGYSFEQEIPEAQVIHNDQEEAKQFLYNCGLWVEK